MKQNPSSKAPESAGSLDRLGPLLERFRVRASLFHAGPLCGVTHFAAEPGRAFLHVLRAGEMQLMHPPRAGAPRKLRVREPALFFYPRPLAHDFHNAPAEGADFVCATLGFEGGDQHPLVRALPPLVHLPLAQLPGAQQTLALLFDETTAPRCGARLLVDRLFEVLLLQLLRALLADPAAHGLPRGLLSGLAQPRLAPVLVALHERPGEAWTLERMAQLAGQSRSSFAAGFKAAMDEAPLAYLTRWRLLLAQQGLAQGRSLKQLAEELGYGTAATLARAFGAQLGQRPRAWRAAAQGETPP